MYKTLSIFLAAAAVAVFTGCESIAIDEDTSSPVPEADPDPRGLGIAAAGGSGYNPGGLGGGGSLPGAGGWVDPKAIDPASGAADSDGWVAIDPENRLGMPVIYFAYDSDVLVPSETANLDKIATYMMQNPSIGLVIEGHCDNRGTDEYNRALGERRANAIRAYLASKGIPDSSLKTLSFGEDKPAVSGSGESIWRQNRRGVPVPMQIPGR